MAYERLPIDFPDDGFREEPVHLDVDILLRISPVFNEQDLAQIASRHLLLSLIKTQETVSGFFPQAKKHRYEDALAIDCFDLNAFAVLFTCQTIVEINDDHGIALMVDEGRLILELHEIYNSAEWKKLGFALYTKVFGDVVKDEVTKVPFSAFLDSDREHWACELEARVCSEQWTYNLTHSGQSQEEIREKINLILLKLHLLFPPAALRCFHELNKCIPGLQLDLVTRNYLGGPLDWRLIRHEVEVKVMEKKFAVDRRLRLTSSEVEVFYGVKVMEFIMQHAHPFGLWTGRYPSNHKVLRWLDQFYD